MSEVVDTTWFNNMSGDVIGLVVIQPQFGPRKAYIGIGDGVDEEDDIKQIKEYGAPVDLHVLQRIAYTLQEQ